jgi:hypothetical protein
MLLIVTPTGRDYRPGARLRIERVTLGVAAEIHLNLINVVAVISPNQTVTPNLSALLLQPKSTPVAIDS